LTDRKRRKAYNRNRGLTDDQKCHGLRIHNPPHKNRTRCNIYASSKCPKCLTPLCKKCFETNTRHANHCLFKDQFREMMI
jgi:hypothetical protein